ncbi:MAG: LysR family transcriptional regulator [Deltaproteobacteria bacterium]|nr:LysR family transcriptional regulator [Deltaproteobacteria bacterium]
MSYDNFKNITMQQIEALKELVEAGSFTRAATNMFITQPTLTKQMKNLEDTVKTKIINRRHTGITLTPEGKILYDYARRILRLRDEAREKVLSLQNHDSGHILISASSIPATYILPPILGQLKKQYPDIRTHLRMTDSEDTYQTILDDLAEIGFVGKEIVDRRLVVVTLWKDRLVLAVPAGHPWYQREAVTLREVEEEPFIMREMGSGTREVMEQFFQKEKGHYGPNFNVVCEIGSSEAVKEAISAGIGISLLSIHALKRELSQGHFREVPIEGCSIERNFYMIYKKQFHLMNHHRKFISLIKNQIP